MLRLLVTVAIRLGLVIAGPLPSMKAQESTATPLATAVTAGDVSMYRGDAARTGVMPGPGPAGQPVELWRYQIEGEIHSAPAIVGGVLYVGGGDGGVYALDAATGTERWRFDAGQEISSSPAVAGDLVYVGSEGGILYALDATTGTEQWQFPGIRADASVAVVDGVVFAGSQDGFLYALDAATGAERWHAALGDSASRSPAVADGIAYVGSADGVLHAVDAATGAEHWTVAIEGGGVLTTPGVADGTLYQATFDGDANALYTFDAATGMERWHFAVPTGDGVLLPTIGDDTVYLPSQDGSIYALDRATGTERWRFATGDAVTAGSVLVGDTLYVGGTDHVLYAIDAATGQERWSLGLDGAVDYGPVVTGGIAYVGTNFGVLYAIGGSDEPGNATPAAEISPASAPTDTGATPATSPVAEAAELEVLWQTTGGSGAFYAIGSLAFDPRGNLWVFDGRGNEFEIFSPDGEFLEAWDGTGGGGEAFNFELSDGWDGDVFFDAEGNISVVEMGARRVQRFDADRNLLATWGGFGAGNGQFIAPSGIVVDAAGNVYVADGQRNDIQKFAPDGTFLTSFGGPGSGDGQLDEAAYLTIDPDDNLWVADLGNHRIVEFSGDGTFLQAFTVTDVGANEFNPIDVALDQAGNVYAADLDNGQVVVFAADGEPVSILDAGTPPAGSNNRLYALAVDDAGHLYLSDESINRVLKVQLPPPLAPAVEPAAAATPIASGPVEFVWKSTGGPDTLAASNDVAIHPDGAVWVLDSGNNRIQILAPDGRFLETWGEAGSGEGQFNLIQQGPDGGLAFDAAGNLYVADSYNTRILKFASDRTFVMAWGGFGTGNVYVADIERGDVQKFDPDGHWLLTFGAPGSGPGQLAGPSYPAVDTEGNLYVAEFRNNRVSTFAPDGTFITSWGTRGTGAVQFQDVNAVSVDAAGTLCLTDAENSRIQVLDAEGRYRFAWTEAGPGEGFYAASTELDGQGNIYIADIGNSRVQKFRLLPQPE